MKSNRCKIVCLGRFAKEFLSHHSSGSVVAVFDRSCYFMRGDELVCIGSRSIGPGPLNILVEDVDVSNNFSEFLIKGQPVTWDQTTIRTGNLSLDYYDAVDWSVPSLREIGDADTISRNVHAFVSYVSDKIPLQGLASLIFQIYFSDDRQRLGPVSGSSEEVFLNTANRSISVLEQWLSARLSELAVGTVPAAGSPQLALSTLLGLGPGLTPSGDDFIGGLIVALYLLKCDIVHNRLAGYVLHELQTKTNPVSAAHLRAAVQGEAAEAIHLLLNDILQGKMSNPAIHFMAIDKIGHSSGWDAVAGSMFALSVWTSTHSDRRKDLR